MALESVNFTKAAPSTTIVAAAKSPKSPAVTAAKRALSNPSSKASTSPVHKADTSIIPQCIRNFFQSILRLIGLAPAEGPIESQVVVNPSADAKQFGIDSSDDVEQDDTPPASPIPQHLARELPDSFAAEIENNQGVFDRKDDPRSLAELQQAFQKDHLQIHRMLYRNIDLPGMLGANMRVYDLLHLQDSQNISKLLEKADKKTFNQDKFAQILNKKIESSSAFWTEIRDFFKS